MIPYRGLKPLQIGMVKASWEYNPKPVKGIPDAGVPAIRRDRRINPSQRPGISGGSLMNWGRIMMKSHLRHQHNLTHLTNQNVGVYGEQNRIDQSLSGAERYNYKSESNPNPVTWRALRLYQISWRPSGEKNICARNWIEPLFSLSCSYSTDHDSYIYHFPNYSHNCRLQDFPSKLGGLV